MGAVYKITNCLTNDCYIGYTTEKNYRKYIKNHFNNKANTKKRLYKAFIKFGKENFIWEIRFRSNNKIKLDNKERELIWLNNCNFRKSGYGYNETDGGQGNKGPKSKETCEKLSRSKLGKPSGMKGKHCSKAHKEKLSKNNKGKLVSEETRKNLSEAMKKVYRSGKYSIWNKGLTKEIDERVAKYGKTFSKNYKNKYLKS